MTLLAAPPLDPAREEAQRWAWQELSDPVYAQHQPGLVERAVLWVWHRLQDLELPSGPGGTSGLVILVALVLLAVVVVWLRAGPLRGPSARVHRQPVLHGATLTAAEHRDAADTAAADGRWQDAVRERFRAIVRSLEERGLVDDLPGRTAQEVADAAAAALPSAAHALYAGARLFDDVSYGSRAATADHDRRLRELDHQVAGTRPQVAAAAVTGQAT
jgi:hypothetical protein